MAHLGYDVLLRQWMLPGSTSDMMSYGSPLWVSDYTYSGLANHLGLSTTERALAPLAAGNGEEHMLVGGLLAGAKSFIGYAFPLDDEQARQTMRRLEHSARPSPDFALHVRDARGASLSQMPLGVARVETEGGDDISMFFNIVSVPKNAARLDVVAANGTTLLSRAAGPAIPKLSVTEPRQGATIGSSLKIAWSASDADKDPLLFSVRYSNDQGKSWRVLADNASHRSLTVPTARLRGGKAVMVEVTASDGLHSARAIAGPFELARHAPEALIYDRSSRRLGPDEPAVIAQSQVLTLRGYGFDAEDGQLPAAALQWQLAGPVTVKATGTKLHFDDLAPGRYMATLDVADADNNHGKAQAAVTVLPKYVAEARESPRIDGRCGDAAYARDADPLLLRFPQAGLVEARLLRFGDALFVCLAGLPLRKTPSDYAGIRLHTVASDAGRLTEGDLGFFVLVNGTGMTARGTAAGDWSFDPSPRGLAAAAATNDRSWSAELRIDIARLGGWDRQILIQVAQYAADGDRAEGAWPKGSEAQTPQSWGAVILGRLTQTIAFAPMPDRSAKLDGFDLAATASSGLPITYSAGGACEVQGNRLTLRGAGASEAGIDVVGPPHGPEQIGEVEIIIDAPGIGALCKTQRQPRLPQCRTAIEIGLQFRQRISGDGSVDEGHDRAAGAGDGAGCGLDRHEIEASALPILKRHGRGRAVVGKIAFENRMGRVNGRGQRDGAMCPGFRQLEEQAVGSVARIARRRSEHGEVRGWRERRAGQILPFPLAAEHRRGVDEDRGLIGGRRIDATESANEGRLAGDEQNVVARTLYHLYRLRRSVVGL
jgi:hypothetical protein